VQPGQLVIADSLDGRREFRFVAGSGFVIEAD